MDIKKIRFDEFTAAVQPDPKSLKEVIYLEGYIGKSNEAGHIRLFFDRALTDFIDIDSEDILHAVPNAKEEDTLGGSKLWVSAKASYKYGDPEVKKRPEAGFMEGGIYEDYERQFEPALSNYGLAVPRTQIKVICTTACPRISAPNACTFRNGACKESYYPKACSAGCPRPVTKFQINSVCICQFTQDYARCGNEITHSRICYQDVYDWQFTPYGM